jgi:ADP-ribosyl-[dinitrogen reductase] hydrolase
LKSSTVEALCRNGAKQEANRMESFDRQRGPLLGLAIGDALGAAVEFQPPGTFPEVTGYRGGGPHGLAAGEFTDDTNMALALADSIANAGWDLTYLHCQNTGV